MLSQRCRNNGNVIVTPTWSMTSESLASKFRNSIPRRGRGTRASTSGKFISRECPETRSRAKRLGGTRAHQAAYATCVQCATLRLRGGGGKKREKKRTRESERREDSPRCVAITFCSTRGSCSRVGCSRSRGYASWEQTNSDLSVRIARVTYALPPLHPPRRACARFSAREAGSDRIDRPVDQYDGGSIRRKDSNRARGQRSRPTVLRARVTHACPPRIPARGIAGLTDSLAKGARARGTDTRNVVYDFHRGRAPFSWLLNARHGAEARI
jgi:hypothetical protein